MRLAPVVTATVLAAVLAGCAPGSAGEPASQASTLPVPASKPSTIPEVVTPVVSGPIEVAGTSPEEVRSDPEVAPTTLTVAGLELDMKVVPVGVDAAGEMEVPERAAVAGWYRFGPGLTSDEGHVVLAAHVDDANGLGPFARLRDVGEGERIVVSAEGVRREYRVTRVEQTDKQEVDLDQVFSRSGAETLVLVTCGGSFDWDSRHYSDNVIVWAEPTEDAS